MVLCEACAEGGEGWGLGDLGVKEGEQVSWVHEGIVRRFWLHDNRGPCDIREQARMIAHRTVQAMEIAVLVQRDPAMARLQILELARRVRFVRAQMANALGISATTLRSYIQELGLTESLREEAKAAGVPVRASKTVPTGASFIYFVRQGVEGPIKIGITGNVQARLGTLQTSNPEPLMLLAEAPGDALTEARLHRVFHGARMHGEWFRPVPELVEFVGALAEGISMESLLEGVES